MSVSSQDENWLKWNKVWSLCRDLVDGSDAVKSGGERYLPKPEGMGKEEYRWYKERAEFFPATGRTLEGYHGLMFRKPVSIEIPDKLRQYLANVDGEGTAAEKFINDTTYDCEITNWGGVLVDVPNVVAHSVKEAESLGVFPYMTFYRAEDIINTYSVTDNRFKKLSLVVLKEVKVKNVDEFVRKSVAQYRVLSLDENGHYKQSVYDETDTLVDEFYPTKLGEPLDHIPFFFLPNRRPYQPMIKGVADVNCAWYRKSADLENGAHWTGVPTPYSVGFSPETTVNDSGEETAKNPIKLGGAHFQYFPEGTTQVGFLEFGGSGLSILKDMMSDDEDRMAILGARIISAEKKGVEAAETARIHRAGENSVLATFANEMSDGFTKAFREYLEWSSGDTLAEDEISVRISTDYDASRMSASELAELVKAWQSGAISKRELFANLQEGEVIKVSESFDAMQAEIDEEESANADANLLGEKQGDEA